MDYKHRQIPTLTKDGEGGGKYITQLQNIPDLASKGPSYWFDEADDVIDIATDINLDPGTGDWSIVSTFNVRGSGAEYTLYGRGEGGAVDNAINFAIQSDGYLAAFIEVSDTQRAVTSNKTVIGTDAHHTAVFTVDRDSVTGLKLYLDGDEETYSTQNDPTALSGAITISSQGHIGENWAGSSSHFSGEIARHLQFNLNLTAAEAKALSSGAPVPFRYVGASQADLIEANSAGSGTAWTDATGTTPPTGWNKGGTVTDFTIDAASGSGDEPALKVTAGSPTAGINLSSPTTLGKRYRLRFIYKNTAGDVAQYSVDGGSTIVDLADSTSWSSEQVVEFTGTGSAFDIYLLCKNNGDIIWWDTVSLTQIGCVLQLEQDGIGHNQWHDKSGNELHGAVTGALPTNLEANHVEKYTDLTLTGNSSFTLPKGYLTTNIMVRETAGNALTGGLDCGISANGVEIISGQAIGANVEINCTLIATGVFGANFDDASDVIYFSDGDDDGNWNSASLKLRVHMQRITMN